MSRGRVPSWMTPPAASSPIIAAPTADHTVAPLPLPLQPQNTLNQSVQGGEVKKESMPYAPPHVRRDQSKGVGLIPLSVTRLSQRNGVKVSALPPVKAKEAKAKVTEIYDGATEYTDSTHTPVFDYNKSLISFKIDPHIPSIVASIADNDTIVVMAPTGTGKSTRIPEAMLHMLRDGGEGKKMVLCTVPTRKAATQLWRFQCERTKLRVGFASNSVIKYNKSSDDIAYTTTGHLVKSFLGSISVNRMPNHCGVLMVDEAHDGKIDTFLLLALVRYLRRLGMSMKLVISSATIAANTFLNSFPGADIIDIKDPHLPVEVLYHHRDYSLPLDLKVMLKDMISVLLDRQMVDVEGTKIVFLPGEDEILSFIELAERLDEFYFCKFYPAYSKLLDEDLDSIFLELPSEYKCKVIVATDIFEHSLTLPGVTFILDSGLVKVMKISSDLIEGLDVEFVSQSSANQRKGRTGRTCEGSVYRMYTKAKYDSLPGLCGQEIDNVPLHKPIIDLTAANLNPFEIMDDIPRARIIDDLRFLIQTKLLVEYPSEGREMPHWTVTELGRFVQCMPVGIKPAIFLYYAVCHQRALRDSGSDVDIMFASLIVASIFEIANPPFWLPQKSRDMSTREYDMVCDDIREKYFKRFYGESDFSTFLKIYCCMETESLDMRGGYFEWAKENHMNNKVLKEWRSNFFRIRNAIEGLGVSYTEDYFIDYEGTTAALEPVFLHAFPQYLCRLESGTGKGAKYRDSEGRILMVGRTFNNTVGKAVGSARGAPLVLMGLSIRKTFAPGGRESLFLARIFLLKALNRAAEEEEEERRQRIKNSRPSGWSSDEEEQGEREREREKEMERDRQIIKSKGLKGRDIGLYYRDKHRKKEGGRGF
jgi:HrpA-like RNA helicase